MSDITHIDGSYQNVAANGDEKDWTPNTSRWQKGDHDRLYFNGDSYLDYVDLDSLRVHTDGSAVRGTANIDGDTLTVEAKLRDGDKVWTATFQLPDDLAEETHDDDDGEEDDPEVATDGGEDVTGHVSDDDIKKAIEQNDADATVEDVRDVLADAQHGFERLWSEYMDLVQNGTFEVVAEDRDVVVFADHGGHEWGEIFEQAGVEREDLRHAVMQVQHTTADQYADYIWATADPVVIRKPESFAAGQQFVEAVVNSLQQRGATPGQAWAYYGVEIQGNSMNSWGHRKGDHDHKNVADALEKAKQKLGEQ